MVQILNMLLFSTFTFTNMLKETTHGNIELGYAFNKLCYKKHSATKTSKFVSENQISIKDINVQKRKK